MPHQYYFFGPVKYSDETKNFHDIMFNEEGITENEELLGFGLRCSNSNTTSGKGETGCLYPRPISIIPVSFEYNKEKYKSLFNDALLANENHVGETELVFPFYQAKLFCTPFKELPDESSSLFLNECCMGHYLYWIFMEVLEARGYVPETPAMSYDRNFTSNLGQNIRITGLMAGML